VLLAKHLRNKKIENLKSLGLEFKEREEQKKLKLIGGFWEEV
jgi:hypothetical protein